MNWNQFINNKRNKMSKKGKKKEETKIITKFNELPDKEASDALGKLVLKQRIDLSFGTPEEFKKPITYVLSKEGIFDVRKNSIGTFTAKIDKCTGFPEAKLEEGLILDLPKIPLNILHQIIGFFKEAYVQHKAEAYSQILFNKEKQEYSIHIPEQNVSGAHVDYKHDNDIYKENILVMDIHSHNTMGAFWSGTDDSDEQRDQMYGVIGDIEKQEPVMKFRMCCGGKHIDLDIEHMFDVPTRTYEFPEEWLKQIKEEKINPQKTWKGYTPSHSGAHCGYQGGLWDDKDDIDDFYSGYRAAMDNDRDPIGGIISKHSAVKKSHSMTDDEFKREHMYDREDPIGMHDSPEGFYDIPDGLIEDDDDNHMTIMDIFDTVVDMPKIQWKSLITLLMHEDAKCINEVVNKLNHKQKTKKPGS